MSPALLVASANFPLGSKMLRQFRGKRSDAKFFFSSSKKSPNKNGKFCVLLLKNAFPRARYSAWQAHFTLPRIRVKQVMTGISSLLPQRAQRCGSILSLDPPPPLSTPHSVLRSFPVQKTWPGTASRSRTVCCNLANDLQGSFFAIFHYTIYAFFILSNQA